MTQVSGLFGSPSPTSTTTPTTSTTPVTATDENAPVFVDVNPGASLGKDDFLKLFIAQMSHQDPTKPMDDAAMMGQMAQFSTLEQMSNMAAVNEAVAVTLVQSQSIGLIGKTVTYVDEAGVEHTGVVERVSTAGGASSLKVDGVDIDPAWITAVS